MNEELIKKETENLLSQIGVEGKVEVTKEDDSFSVLIDSTENALLIGKYGNTLSSLQLILSMIVSKKADEYRRITVEIGGYRKEREEYLRGLSERLKNDVLETGAEKTIRGLKPWERRFVHLLFQEDLDVATESSGEGRDRVLVIKRKSA